MTPGAVRLRRPAQSGGESRDPGRVRPGGGVGRRGLLERLRSGRVPSGTDDGRDRHCRSASHGHCDAHAAGDADRRASRRPLQRQRARRHLNPPYRQPGRARRPLSPHRRARLLPSRPRRRRVRLRFSRPRTPTRTADAVCNPDCRPRRRRVRLRLSPRRRPPRSSRRTRRPCSSARPPSRSSSR